MLKGYEELRKVDVRPYCKDRDGIPYLNWAKCIELLRKYGAEKVYFEPVPDERTGSSLRMSGVAFTDSKNVVNRCYETRIKVVIDDNEYIMQSPVMNGTNPVRDNSMNQIRVWNSMCRSFVKCVAIHTGLGFDMWVKGENAQEIEIPDTLQKPASKSKVDTIKNLCISHGIDGDAWVAGNGKTWETLTEREAAQMLNALKQRYGDE